MIIFFLLLFLMGLSIVFGYRFYSSEKKAVFQSKAQSIGIEKIQEQINSAPDGAVITIPPGTYSGPTAIPLGLGDNIFVSDSRGASEWCFLRIENKKITIKGRGAVLFGEGHDKPYQDPYQHRAGVCVINSTVTFDGLRIKEFQKRGMVVYNSTIVYKNGIVDGCDEGGISMLGNSAGLIINNLIAEHNFGGVMLWQNTQVKIINNTFYNGGIMFFYHPKIDDQAKADIINNIIVSYTDYAGRASITQVDWWKEKIPKLKENNVRTNLFWKGEYRCWEIELCDFPGKISADPLFIEPVTDPRGVAAWANFNLKEGSPAIGAGSPDIPGPKNLGHTGGPCVEPDSSTCLNFIKANTPSPFVSSSSEISEPVIDELPVENKNDQNIPEEKPKEIYKVETKVGPQKETRSMFVKQARLFLQNSSLEKRIIIKGFLPENQNFIPIEISLDSNTVFEYDYSNLCRGFDRELKGGLFFSSSSDNFSALKYKKITLDCFKAQVIDFE